MKLNKINTVAYRTSIGINISIFEYIGICILAGLLTYFVVIDFLWWLIEVTNIWENMKEIFKAILG